MKWIEILRKDDVALLQSKNNTQYAVVTGYNPNAREDEQWDYGWYYTYWSDKNAKINSLRTALEYFMIKTVKNYIPRYRLEELATQFKDGLIEDDKESAIQFFDEVCEMDEREKEFFGIESEE